MPCPRHNLSFIPSFFLPQDCWAQDPEDRPTFETVRRRAVMCTFVPQCAPCTAPLSQPCASHSQAPIHTATSGQTHSTQPRTHPPTHHMQVIARLRGMAEELGQRRGPAPTAATLAGAGAARPSAPVPAGSGIEARVVLPSTPAQSAPSPFDLGGPFSSSAAAGSNQQQQQGTPRSPFDAPAAPPQQATSPFDAPAAPAGTVRSGVPLPAASPLDAAAAVAPTGTVRSGMPAPVASPFDAAAAPNATIRSGNPLPAASPFDAPTAPTYGGGRVISSARPPPSPFGGDALPAGWQAPPAAAPPPATSTARSDSAEHMAGAAAHAVPRVQSSSGQRAGLVDSVQDSGGHLSSGRSRSSGGGGGGGEPAAGGSQQAAPAAGAKAGKPPAGGPHGSSAEPAAAPPPAPAASGGLLGKLRSSLRRSR